MSKVFIIQRSTPNNHGWTPDLGPASNYGSFEFIFDADDKVYADPASAKKKLLTRLRDFNGEEDFLLWPNAGDPAAQWLTIMVLAANGHKRLKFLYWQKPRHKGGEGFYLPIELDASLGGK